MRTAASPCWNLLLLLWAYLNSSVQKMCLSYEIQVPENYTALGGDLQVTIIDLLRTASEDVRLELLEVEYVPIQINKKVEKREINHSVVSHHGALIKFIDTRNLTHPQNLSALTQNDLSFHSKVLESGREKVIPDIEVEREWTVLGSVVVPVNESDGGKIVKVGFPCGVVTRGGHFGVRLTGFNKEINNLTRRHRNFKFNKLETSSRIEEIGSNLSVVGLDVRWPASVLSISPRHVETYPDVSVSALVQFLPTKCSPVKGAPIPETWLDLLFCGHSVVGCADGNSSYKQVVYSEQIRGYPRKRVIALKCELFGSAGHYALTLRSSVLTGSLIDTNNKDAYLKAVWSEHYIFNVHARSIFPCDIHGGGVPVLFQYPRCILKGDRVRLFSRLRAEVSSLVPPTTLHYVTEQRVVKGKHSLHFDCDFFSEKYVEYCFVYVSQAITGAVSDVRMDCVPTLPVYDSDSGNWGSWNEWSACSTTCGGGTRNRFRYCDSPPPKYGAKFCEGPSVETERCGNADWDCEFYQSYQSEWKGTDLPADRPEIVAEVGPGCRCGCVIHLGPAKPRRLLATSSQSCPGRIFWQIEADKEHVIRFSVEHFRFPCGSQWLKVRDGDSRSSTLIGELSRSHPTSVPVISSGSKLLIEFFSDELLASGQECWGGFLAHAQQTPRPFSNVSSITSGFSISNILRNMEVAPTASTSLFLVHCFVALFICAVILISGCLGIQYVLRYRKYQLAAAAEDADSTEGDSQSSLVAVRSRATSNSTLLSEVISLQRFKPTKKYRHRRLKEDEPEMEEEQLSESSESQLDENHKTPSSSLKTLKPEAAESLASTPGYSRKSQSPHRSSTPEESSDNQVSQSYLKKLQRNNQETSSPETPGNSSSLISREEVRTYLQRRRRSLSSSSTKSGSTLTNDCYSPESSLGRRTRNPKAKKEKRNLEKLLAGSEFSLPDDGDLELDYYDYDVQNASAVPNSYIGMDPAYLVWIPPFSPGLAFQRCSGLSLTSKLPEMMKPILRVISCYTVRAINTIHIFVRSACVFAFVKMFPPSFLNLYCPNLSNGELDKWILGSMEGVVNGGNSIFPALLPSLLPPCEVITMLESIVDWDDEGEKTNNDDNIELKEPLNEDTVGKWRENVDAEYNKRESAELNNGLVPEYDNRVPDENHIRDSLVEKSPARSRHTYFDSRNNETRVGKSPSEGSDYYRIIEDIKYADDEDDDLKIDITKCDIYSMKTLKEDNGQLKV